MPVEIRELIIQARLREDARQDQASGNSQQEQQPAEPDLERITDLVYERCVAKLKEWLADQSNR
ncbi:MAG: hypothetical protein RL013_2661 [Bacteroidota bacterium]|jgi:hypothetical protein